MGRPESHGHAKNGGSLTYRSWQRMINRCENPNSDSYQRYGSVGVKVCNKWHSFSEFLKDMGERKSVDYSLDRIDYRGNYEPNNCRWATSKEQARNKKSNRVISFFGKTMCLMDWSIYLGTPYETIQSRLRRGWGIKKSLFGRI